MQTLSTSAPSATSSVTFQRERWARFYEDGKELFPLHWRELAVNQERIVMDIDESRYAKMEELDMLYLLGARDGENLVGYLMAFLMPHFHYKSSGKMAVTDMYWVRPEYRNGLGLRMFVEFEKRMRELKVVQMITSCKVHQDHSRLFELLGWTWTDKTFCKVIG
jgi:hypothetical protein